MPDANPPDLPSNVIRLPVRNLRPQIVLEKTGTGEPSARSLLQEVQSRVKPSLRVLHNIGPLPPIAPNPLPEETPLPPPPANPATDLAADPWALFSFDPQVVDTDARLAEDYGLVTCLRQGVLPLRKYGNQTLVVMRKQKRALHIQHALEQMFGPVSIRFAPAQDIETLILAKHGPALAKAAETRAPLHQSARGWNSTYMTVLAVLAFGLMGFGLTTAPVLLGQIGLGLATLSLILCLGLKIMAALATLRPATALAPPPPDQALPSLSIIVALYRESDIAERLVVRLARLEYPRHLLELILAVEAEDHLTRDALSRAELPAWMRIIVVPAGAVKTKPRALNFALDHCQGDIIGVYDAEDAPEPQQLRHIARHFMMTGPEVACVQGVLDFYNPTRNWLSRCFTMEYASWFRAVLPGIARLGLVVPLGGTTLFFRKDILIRLGGWDAHNVTEDADLGLRLYRHGFRTEVLATTTYEEANCRALPWVKQRSRWIKGYMMTWAVHMRHPFALWRDLGTTRFLALQVQFLCPLLQFLLAPLFWSLWLVPFGLPHPLVDPLPNGSILALSGLFLLTELTAVLIGLLALHRSRQSLNRLWLLTQPLYYPLASLAAFKAAWEMLWNPFYWDKTSHGAFSAASA